MPLETVKDLGLALARDLGYSSFDPTDDANNRNGRGGITDGDKDACARALTGSLQEIYHDGPASLSERRFSEILRPPQNVTLNVIQYAKTISAFVGWQAWMEGCTIRIDGDPLENELLSATELLRPVTRASGATTGIVYADAIPLPSAYSHIIEPVSIPGVARLSVKGTREEFDLYLNSNPIRTLHGVNSSAVGGFTKKSIGQPDCCFVDTHYDGVSAFMPIYLRVACMPGSAYPIEFRVKVKPPVVTAADFGDVSTDPGTILPMDWLESVLLPFARQRLTSDPLFTNDEGKDEIARQFGIARQILDGSTPGISRKQGVYR